MAQLVAGAHDRAHLQLDVEPLAGTEGGRIGVGRFRLPVGADDVGARDDDGGCAPVVADGNVQPVGRQRVLRTAEHRADIGGVMRARVEIGEFGHDDRQFHAARRPWGRAAVPRSPAPARLRPAARSGGRAARPMPRGQAPSHRSSRARRTPDPRRSRSGPASSAANMSRIMSPMATPQRGSRLLVLNTP